MAILMAITGAGFVVFEMLASFFEAHKIIFRCISYTFCIWFAQLTFYDAVVTKNTFITILSVVFGMAIVVLIISQIKFDDLEK